MTPTSKQRCAVATSLDGFFRRAATSCSEGGSNGTLRVETANSLAELATTSKPRTVQEGLVNTCNGLSMEAEPSERMVGRKGSLRFADL